MNSPINIVSGQLRIELEEPIQILAVKDGSVQIQIPGDNPFWYRAGDTIHFGINAVIREPWVVQKK